MVGVFHKLLDSIGFAHKVALGRDSICYELRQKQVLVFAIDESLENSENQIVLPGHRNPKRQVGHAHQWGEGNLISDISLHVFLH